VIEVQNLALDSGENVVLSLEGDAPSHASARE
jgi:hypothetical protein